MTIKFSGRYKRLIFPVLFAFIVLLFLITSVPASSLCLGEGGHTFVVVIPLVFSSFEINPQLSHRLYAMLVPFILYPPTRPYNIWLHFDHRVEFACMGMSRHSITLQY